MLSDDLRIPILDDRRVTGKGPAALAEDLMTPDLTRGAILQRRAVVPELACPVPAHRHGAAHPRMEPDKAATMSARLAGTEIPVEGVETDITAG